jgi:hypothetical protein
LPVRTFGIIAVVSDIRRSILERMLVGDAASC